MDTETDAKPDVISEQEESTPTVGLTQEQVDAVIGRERGVATAKAQRDLLKSMGFETVEEAKAAKAIIEAQREADLAEMSEAKQLEIKANEAMAAAATVQARAEREASKASLTTALLTAEGGAINPARIGLATTVALSFLADADLEGDEAVVAAVAHVKDQSPEWFTSVGPTEDDESNGESSRTPAPPGKKPGAKPPGPKGSDTQAKAQSIFDEWRSTNRKKFDPLQKD